MANMNQVTLLGNLTRDPELRYTQSGTPVANLSLAVNTKYRQGDVLREETLYVDVTVFGRQAETCAQYLFKGSPILIEGRLRLRSWETPEGDRRSKHDVLANNVQFLHRREAAEMVAAGVEEGDEPDDLPF